MIKRTVNYENWNGEKVSKDLYFNLSEPELMDMEVDSPGVLTDQIRDAIKNDDANEKYKLFKMIVLAAYGEKSDDGEQFIKSEEITKKFTQSPAYGAFFMDLIENSDEKTVEAFFAGIFPARLIEKGKELQEKEPERFGTIASIVNKEN